MKLRENQCDNFDLMFRVCVEGYMISSCMRKKYPRYVPKMSKRGDQAYPFVLNLCALPESYGGVPVGKSMPISDANACHQRNTESSDSESNEKSTFESEIYSTENNIRPSQIVHTNKTRNKHFRNGQVPKVGGTAVVQRKRKVHIEADGLNNCHTVHFRSTVFGDKAYLRGAGSESQPCLNVDAAQGRLYHTVTNIPVDVENFNEGFNSDAAHDDAQVEWRRKDREDHIDSFVDVLPTEKYFMSLWNSFVTRNGNSKSDRGVLELYRSFVEKYGSEVRRMKLEVCLVQQIALLWRYGIIDTNGLLEIMGHFKHVQSNNLRAHDPNFSLPHLLLHEKRKSYNQWHRYTGRAKVRSVKLKDAGMRAWMTNNLETSVTSNKIDIALRAGSELMVQWMDRLTTDKDQ